MVNYLYYSIYILAPIFFLILLFFITTSYRSYRIINYTSSNNEKNDHIAIIAVVYPRKYYLKNIFVYFSGIELLTKGLNELKEAYTVYRCSSPQKFQEIINKENTKRIWIFSHGMKHGVNFGKEMLYYCEVNDEYKKTGLPPKQYIKQLHCNHNGGKSLIDYICENKEDSYVTNDIRYAIDNRKYIKKYIQNRKKMKQYPINV